MKKNNLTLKGKIRLYLNDETTKIGRIAEFFIVSLNIFTIFAFILESYYYKAAPSLFWTIEIITVSIFIIEYLLRYWVAEKKIKHLTNIYSIIDLIAIIPTFIPFIDLRFVRVFRVFRIFRFIRYIDKGRFLSRDAQIHQIRIIRIVFTITSIIFVFSSFIYELEKYANPLIANLGDAIYFSIVTLTTVGYGDITPVTQPGKIMTILMIFVSIALIPWQFTLLIREVVFSVSNKKFIVCETCGLRQHDFDAIHCKHCGKIIYQEIDSV
jgi:voltage-gated potassium channel